MKVSDLPKYMRSCATKTDDKRASVALDMGAAALERELKNSKAAKEQARRARLPLIPARDNAKRARKDLNDLIEKLNAII